MRNKNSLRERNDRHERLRPARICRTWGEPLLRRDQKQRLVPALAESYTAGPNAEFYDFMIREGARCSDGVPITAHDWVFTDILSKETGRVEVSCLALNMNSNTAENPKDAPRCL